MPSFRIALAMEENEG